jgi:hypothetical protein
MVKTWLMVSIAIAMQGTIDQSIPNPQQPCECTYMYTYGVPSLPRHTGHSPL